MVKLKTVRLFLPDAELAKRIGLDATPLSNYIKSLQNVAEAFWKTLPEVYPNGLLVTIGVRPNSQSRAWCDPVDGRILAETLEHFSRALEQVPALPVMKGPIAFAMELGLTDEMPAEFPLMPLAWKAAVKTATRPLAVPDQLFEEIWPETNI